MASAQDKKGNLAHEGRARESAVKGGVPNRALAGTLAGTPGVGSSPRDWWILGIILLLGAALRLSYWVELKKEPIFSAPIADAAFHDYWARAIVSGNWTPPPGEPDPRIREVPFLRPPGYAYFLAGLYKLTGGSLNGVRLAQMLLGLINCILAFLLGKAAGNRRVGLILAGFCALYWAFPYYEGQLHAPVLIITLSFAFLLVLHRGVQNCSILHSAIAGILLGLIALVRAETLLFIPVAAGWLYYQEIRLGRSGKPAFLLPMVLVLGAILGLAPATIRNARVAKEFVLISANGPINLYVGNNETSDGWSTRIPDLPELTGSSGWSCFSYDQIVSALSQKEERKLSYTEASAIFSRKAREYISSHPGRFLALTLKRAALFWGPEEVANNEAIKFEKANSSVLRWNPGFPVILGLSLGGLILLILDRRSRRQKEKSPRPDRSIQQPMLVLIGLYILTCFAALLPFIAASRFRAPVLPLIFVFGAVGLDRLLLMASAKDWRRFGWSLAGAGALTALASLSLAGVKTDPAWWHTDRALALIRHGEKREAVVELQAALQANPGFVDAHVNLASLLADLGQVDQAIAHLREVLRYRPNRADVRQQLATLLLRQGRAEEAVREMRQVARESPGLPTVEFNLGRALLQAKDYAGSIEAFTRLLNATPDEPAAYVNRGLALVRSGAANKALPDFQRALQLKPDLANAYSGLGQAYVALGNFDKAAQSYQEAFRLDPTNIEPLINIGNIWANRKEYDKAIVWYRRTLDADPKNVIALYNLAGCQAESGMRAEAAQTANRLLEIDPQNQPARRLLDGLRGPGSSGPR